MKRVQAHVILPPSDLWWLVENEDEGIVEAFDFEGPLFSGPLIAPKEYRKRDPRRWSKETLNGLVDSYGLAAGSKHGTTVFSLAEVVALRLLLGAASRAQRRAVAKMSLSEALEVARSFYFDVVDQYAIAHAHCSDLPDADDGGQSESAPFCIITSTSAETPS